MEKKNQATPIVYEKKERIPVWLYPAIIAKIESYFERDNCKSKSEYMEKAIDFYTGYINSKNSSDFLCSTLLSAMGGTIYDSENRIARKRAKRPMYTNKHAWTNKAGAYKEIYYYVCSKILQRKSDHG